MTWPAAFAGWIIWLAGIGPLIGGVVVFLLICAVIG